LGSPPQQLRLLPSTSLPHSLVVGTSGCSESMTNYTYRFSPSETIVRNCFSSRGNLYNRTLDTEVASQGPESGAPIGINYKYDLTPYQTIGNFDYNVTALGLQSNLSFGYDVGPRSYIAPVFEFAKYEFTWLGLLGIDARPVNFTASEGAAWIQKPSLIEHLRTANAIPSRSWGYTAGSYNRKKQVNEWKGKANAS
jgi:hypothetical protein